MKKLGRNALAVGAATLLITSAASFSASAAEEYESFAEAQYVLGAGQLDGPIDENLVDNVVESPSTDACEPTEPDCPAQDSTESALGDALLPLTTGLGDALGGIDGTGVVGDYAAAEDGQSYAASGALSSEGAIDLGSEADPRDPVASFSLSSGALEPLANAVADVRVEIQAASAAANLVPGDDDSFPEPVWSEGNTITPDSEDSGLDYNIAGGDVVIDVPALAGINPAIAAVADGLPEDADINLVTLCNLVGNTLTIPLSTLGIPTLPPPLDTLTSINACSTGLPQNVQDALTSLLNAQITGLNAVTDGLEGISEDGITFSFADGEIRIDLAVAIEALTDTDINELDPDTNLLEEILPALVLNLDELVSSIYDDLVSQLLESAELTVTVGGTPIPVSLNPEATGPLNDALGQVFDGLDTALETVGDPLADALETLVGELEPLLQLRVNVPNAYAAVRAAQAEDDGGVGILAADTVYSNTALRVIVAQPGDLTDLLLGNALVGPNAALDVDDADDADGADDGDGGDADGGDADGAVADGDGDGQADSIGDGDAQADADVTSSLPAAGAPNLLPFWLLGLGLVLFGAAVLINERRRITV